jgi:hypothetical protein
MIDLHIERECILLSFRKRPGPCPRCGGPLESQHAIYLIVTKDGTEINDSLIISEDWGWFCPQCPTVVIDPGDIQQALQFTLPTWDVGTEGLPAGIIDLDGIPPEKQHLPLGHEDVDLPLIPFSAVIDEDDLAAGQEAPELRNMVTTSTPPSPRTFEQRYEDVLQNIELGIIKVYREHAEMTDWHARSAIEALLRGYRALARGHEVRPPSLKGLGAEVYEAVHPLCEWRLGRQPFPGTDGGAEPEPAPEPITVDEMIDCLKRVRKSIRRWSRQGGRRGYLTFVDQYIP